ncbi:hypothetical protein FT663_04930 [Candidozyma haemuli var. vulneris]|uniref:BSD domain-containing protein n=1 Tax=Candidozyma haemuli TaxID=45357 RepID=A0A2V1B0T5_9ASCO|nr:hypothetical protein CXQ85_003027 [[Candida] haemuloni]KAF3986315.1 hypothetical protein FT663_04930 [[Candida] haemuloni var. vulneris]KAF3986977.1 hypothetical protein FT662_04256 [[Candida] haemuloni var. vulneris]PVH23293.1 hypothetical protein CXQ85_003027 [[Candida] haemuloni]
MATVSGACVISKVSGLVQIREDTAPSKLMWKAIDQDKSLEIPLNALSKLQTTPESSPKMILKLFYSEPPSTDIKDIRLTFNNRQTMTSVKDALQTIIARQKTIIKDSPAPAEGKETATASPAPGEKDATSTPEGTPAPGNPLDFSSPKSLSDASLLKNHKLQQKLLLEDKNLRNVFTQSVIKFKLSPMMFWSSRISQLRTCALQISQHRGPYNVLSTIKPVATSDNQVNVNVTRVTINEIFDTYPIIKRAFDELVPSKLNEGEFWSRFFNSKLFRRLRGDRVNTQNTRGDVVIDKYLYDDGETPEEPAKKQKTDKINTKENFQVNKFLDLFGNEEDNPQKLGLSPDFTMKFSDEGDGNEPGISVQKSKRENEMVILMKNMNKLSSKMVEMNSSKAKATEDADTEVKEHEQELDLNDLNESEDVQFIQLHIDTDKARGVQNQREATPEEEKVESAELGSFLTTNIFTTSASGNDLSETYKTKTNDIAKAATDITALVKYNFRSFKSLHNLKDATMPLGEKLLPEDVVSELLTYNVTIVEFLSHFWNLFLNTGNPSQLKKLFTNLRSCQSALDALESKISGIIKENAHVKDNEKLQSKLLKDLENCVSPLKNSLQKACTDYIAAVKASQKEASTESETPNENGKRPLET